ncbi:MAG: class I SAM-dependent methyltransferase [Gammaproteobacteria bacterium]
MINTTETLQQQAEKNPTIWQYHKQCLSHLQHLTEQAGGLISFATFMEQALYGTGVGFYTSGHPILGEQGHFTTASELSPLYAQCFAQQADSLLQTYAAPTILELGPGSGTFAAHMLLALEALDSLPEKYLLMDISERLRQQQQHTLRTISPHLMERVQWITDFPTTPFSGLILGHEVIDALPVHLFTYHQQQYYEQGVKWDGEKFHWQPLPITNTALKKALEPIKPLIQGTTPYTSEINLNSALLLQKCNKALKEGLIVLVDYGFPAREYYHPQRSEGTLMCHYAHHSHNDPLILCGIQDITAHVDFTTLANNGIDLGLTLAGYTNQSAFLMDCGLLKLAETIKQNTPTAMQTANAIKKLLMPQEMGELFKVIAFRKNYEGDVIGFSHPKPL